MRKVPWVAVSIFFLAGCVALAVPELEKAILFGGLYSAHTSFEHHMVFDLIPGHFVWLAALGFLVAALLVLVPLIRYLFHASMQIRTRTESLQPPQAPQP